MPYITELERKIVDREGERPWNPGTLNYAVTRLVDQYLVDRHACLVDELAGTDAGPVSPLYYEWINEVIGVLECAKLELYRRVAAPYEDDKRLQNGDVYSCQN